MKNHELYPHYFKDVSHLDSLDIYMILQLWECKDNALGHAIKKLLVPGGRGSKDRVKDVKEARDTLNRWLQIQEQCAKVANEVKLDPFTETGRKHAQKIAEAFIILQEACARINQQGTSK